MLCVAWRTPCLGLRSLGLHPPNLAAPFRSLGRPISPAWCLDSTPRRLLGSTRSSTALFTPAAIPKVQCPYPSRNRSRGIHSSAALSAEKPTSPPAEKGVQLRKNPFSKAEIDRIFGPRTKLSPAIGNRILSVLQARRLAGTLDLDFPADVKRAARPATLDAGLEYLRRNYPLDEEAAILARVEQEERETDEKFAQDAEQQGLWKPQSGHYGAELGEENDPSGKSVLKEIRERNEKRINAEEEENRREWLEGEQKHREQVKQNLAQNTALQRFDNTSEVEGKLPGFEIWHWFTERAI